MTELPWRPSRRTVILIGILSVWPFVYMAMFFAMFAYTWFSFSGGTASAEPGLFKYIFPLHCLTMLMIFVLMGVYVFHAYKTNLIAPDKKMLWLVILFLGNLLAFPFYWYLYMWRDVSRTGVEPEGSIPAG